MSLNEFRVSFVGFRRLVASSTKVSPSSAPSPFYVFFVPTHPPISSPTPAASLKSLSVSDTDLLSITLSTLFLLDTLLHLLRARGETLDLLALRLQWDSMRFAVARETEGLERDVKAFVEGKGRWGVEKYEKGGLNSSGGGGSGMGSPVLGTMVRERDGAGGGHGREGSETGSIRSIGGSLKVASRSQRYRESASLSTLSLPSLCLPFFDLVLVH